jgi:hypothetical protein
MAGGVAYQHISRIVQILTLHETVLNAYKSTGNRVSTYYELRHVVGFRIFTFRPRTSTES